MNRLVVAVTFAVAVSTVSAADPPTLVNYQGVLRDASDKPRAGTFDMVFRFFDAPSAGNEILVDAHTGGGGNSVTVTGGLFNVQLGGGTLSDGSGAGTYTSLDQVFRDYGAVYLQITVGAETLSPRIRVQSAAYALNASNLEGKPASSFVDTTGSTQTKAGHLIVNDGLEGNSSSTVGVQGIGAQSGGTFANQAITAVAHLGYNFGGGQYGVHGQGATAGGWFQDSANTGYAYLGQPGYGIKANGAGTGGYFTNNLGDYSYEASNGYGLFASATSTGVYAYGPTNGGVFGNGVSSASLGSGGYGVDATGSFAGGYFHNSYSDGRAFVGSGDYGISAGGNYIGGYFYDTNSTGVASVGYGDLGIDASGAQAGGHFAKPSTNAQAYLAASNGTNENGVYGLSNGYSESPGYFVDQYWGTWVYVGYDSKVNGNGGVYFDQNDPTDASRVIQYCAPEGDEVGVYTRGTARLSGGTARVTLGETFPRVSNPDIGLTVQLTPHGSPVPLAVESVSTSELVVRGPADGPQDVMFDYAVWGLRIGFEDHPVVRPKRQEAFIPATQPDEALYASQPQLASFTAHQRFARMDSAVDPERAATRTSTASDALKAAIHVYNRETDLPALLAASPQDANVIQARNARATGAGAEDHPASSQPAAASVIAPRLFKPPLPAVPSPTFPSNTTAVQVAETVEPGDVVAMDRGRSGELRRASTAADPGVVGIVAGEPGTTWNETAPLALAGVVLSCKVDASYGAIAANDLLVASPTAGHAMRAGENPRQGTVVGKALEPLEAGAGTIRVLVMSR